MKYTDVLPTLRERTSPSAERVQRVRLRLDQQLRTTRAELSHLPAPQPEAIARVAARIRASRGAQGAPQRWAAGALGLGALAFAAAAAVGGYVALRPPAEHATSLAGSGLDASIARGLSVTHDGTGAAVRKGKVVDIAWEYGRLVVELEAARDLTVEVRTPEGEVHLSGPASTEASRVVVVRDALGTRIDVDRGAAGVSCGVEATGAFDSTAGTTCLPQNAAGWLNRVRALEQGATAPEALVQETDRALTSPGTPAEQAELWTVRTTALTALGRHRDAIASAESALGLVEDPGRAEGLHRAAARLGVLAGDCDAALRHFDALPSLEPEEAAHRAHCAHR